MAQYGFHFDGTLCTGCKTCVLACKDVKDLPSDIAFRNVYEYGGGTWMQDASGAWTTDAFTCRCRATTAMFPPVWASARRAPFPRTTRRAS